MTSNNDTEKNNFINLLKNIMKEGEIHFIDFIINNTEKIKKLDSHHKTNNSSSSSNYNSNSNYYDSEQKKNPKNIIAELKKDTLFYFFRINSWTELVNVMTLNHKMRTLINSGEIPSYTIFKIIVNSFKKIFGEYVSCNMLHFLTATSDNYLIYILNQWLKQTKTSHLCYYNILPTDKVELFKNLNDDDIPNSYSKAIECIKFSTIDGNETWNITSHPIYYENSKLYVICTSYDGMGWYHTLAISMKKRNKNSPFVFCLDGGSSGIDRKNNIDFFQNNQPLKRNLLSFDEMRYHIKNSTFKSVIFQL
jgi:hypothetical protein